MKAPAILAMALLVHTLPLAAQAAKTDPASSSGIRSEIRHDLDEAKREVRSEMAQARTELETENLSVRDSLRFGEDSDRRSSRKDKRPEGEITPKGDFLVAGKAVEIDARQRRQLLDYRGQLIDIAKVGIDAGEQAAMLAIDATDVSVFRLIVGGLSGSLGRRVEATAKRSLEPMARQICGRLPQLRQAQQSLAATLPEFRPYATLETDDIEDCESDVRNELATR